MGKFIGGIFVGVIGLITVVLFPNFLLFVVGSCLVGLCFGSIIEANKQ